MSAGDWKEMITAVQQGNITLVQYHVESGIDPNYEHPEIMTTPLIESIHNEQYEIAKYLLEKGANPKQKSLLSTDNPLQIAEKNQKMEFAKLLKSYIPKRRFWWNNLK